MNIFRAKASSCTKNSFLYSNFNTFAKHLHIFSYFLPKLYRINHLKLSLFFPIPNLHFHFLKHPILLILFLLISPSLLLILDLQIIYSPLLFNSKLPHFPKTRLLFIIISFIITRLIVTTRIIVVNFISFIIINPLKIEKYFVLL